MGPELFDPVKFGLEDDRRTKSSDCYAFGMATYEVLSGHVPFYPYPDPSAVMRILTGKRPERPQGTLFTDDIWRVLEDCWKPDPGHRPTIEHIFLRLEEASRLRAPLPPLRMEDPLTADLSPRAPHIGESVGEMVP